MLMTRRSARALLGFMLVAAGAAMVSAGPAGDAWLIVPGVRVGAITRTTSEIDLVRAYGHGNVRTGNINVGEGVTERGTLVFPDEPIKRAAVLWKDLSNNQMPERIQITGSKTLWKTAQGITLGMSLRELERLNGRPFVLTGFGWDYGGTIISWERGALARAFATGGRIILRLRPPSGLTPGALRPVTGDRESRSNHGTMQRLNPRVYQMIIEFK